MKPSEILLARLTDMRSNFARPDLADVRSLLVNLIFVHQIIVATENLLRLAIANSSGHLHAYFVEHLTDERDHEKWLAEDLSTAAIDISAMPHMPEAVAMSGSQYYLIHHVDAAALLGYMAALECFPMTVERVDELEKLHGTPLCRTLRHHAEHDISHGAEVLKMIDSLSDRQAQIAVQNAINSTQYLGRVSQLISNGGRYHG